MKTVRMILHVAILLVFIALSGISFYTAINWGTGAYMPAWLTEKYMYGITGILAIVTIATFFSVKKSKYF